MKHYQATSDVHTHDEDNWAGPLRIFDKFTIDKGDQIKDILAGKNFIMIITEQSKMYAQGYVFYRYLSDSQRYNDERYEDYPFEIKLPEGATNPTVWPLMKEYTFFVTCDVGETRKTYSYGYYYPNKIRGS